MEDYFLEIRRHIFRFLNLESWKDGFRRVSKNKKISILAVFILVLCMRLFFYNDFENKVYAETIDLNEEIDSEIVDPMNKIGKGIINSDSNLKKANFCDKKTNSEILKNKDLKVERKKKELTKMVEGYPIEKMIPFIAKRDEKTTAFLVAIARKESTWGQHAPSRNGRDCYNYWGYKGNYRLVLGYSCFDSPEQAVQIVGDKIDQLIAKKIDTPAKMVVWKCGSSCAGHDPGGVRSWIGTVESYVKKLIS